MVDRFFGLRHHTIVRRHHQNHDVGCLRAARAHGGERLVAGRVEKGHHAARGIDVVSADVLGDPARFARGDPGAADVVEERGLAVIDVAHHGHHRRSRLQHGILVRGRLQQEGIRIIRLGLHRLVPHLFHQNHRGFLIQHLVDGHHRTHLHQGLDDFGRLDRHLLRQIGHADGFRNSHFLHDRLGGQGESVLRRLMFCVLVMPPGAQGTAAAQTDPGARIQRARRRTFLVSRLVPRTLLDGGSFGRLARRPRHFVAGLEGGFVQGAFRHFNRHCHHRFGCFSHRLRFNFFRHRFDCGLALAARLFGFQIGRLAGGQLGRHARFFLARLDFLLVQHRRRRGHAARFFCRCRRNDFLLDGTAWRGNRALLAHFDLNRARTPATVGFFDRRCLAPGYRDLALARAVRAAQVLQQLGLVLFGDRVGIFFLADSGRLQLLQQQFDRQSKLAGKLRYIYFSHFFPSVLRTILLRRTRARAPS